MNGLYVAMNISTFVGFKVFLSLQKEIIGTLWDIIIICLIFHHFSVYCLAHYLVFWFSSVFFFLCMNLWLHPFTLDFFSFNIPVLFQRSSLGYSFRFFHPTWHIVFFSFGVLVVSQKTLALLSAFVSFGSSILAIHISWPSWCGLVLSTTWALHREDHKMHTHVSVTYLLFNTFFPFYFVSLYQLDRRKILGFDSNRIDEGFPPPFF